MCKIWTFFYLKYIESIWSGFLMQRHKVYTDALVYTMTPGRGTPDHFLDLSSIFSQFREHSTSGHGWHSSLQLLIQMDVQNIYECKDILYCDKKKKSYVCLYVDSLFTVIHNKLSCEIHVQCTLHSCNCEILKYLQSI